MNPKAIMDKAEGLVMVESRQIQDDYVEVVFLNAELQAWQKHLEMFLGPALKPAGHAPEARHELMAKPYGGIRTGQTLYGKEFGPHRIVALLWPWQDNMNTTLKMYYEKG